MKLKRNNALFPTKIAFPTKTADSRIENAYTAAGTKIKETIYTAGILTHTTDYSGAFVYKDNWLAYILTPEGRIVIPQPTGTPSGKTLTAASYYYEYQLKDHLGNVRVTFTDKDKNGVPEVQSENHYYPFGMPIGALSYTNNVSTLNSIDYKNEYFYNGKEAEDDFGLGWLDYGFRDYDPVIGRWWCIDAMAEKYYNNSPYVYCANNPISFFDPNGMVIAGDTAMARKVENNARSSIDNENSKQNKLENRRQQKLDKGKSTKGVDRKIARSVERSKILMGLVSDIESLRNSSTTYFVNSAYVPNAANGDPDGYTGWDAANNRVDINISTSYGENGLAHELTHGAQFDRGQLDFAGTAPGLLYDIFDEVAAYRAEYAYSGSGFQQVNSEWVRNFGGGIYSHLPDIQLTTQTTLMQLYFANPVSHNYLLPISQYNSQIYTEFNFHTQYKK
jgi:RHS repeat-associated protein